MIEPLRSSLYIAGAAFLGSMAFISWGQHLDLFQNPNSVPYAVVELWADMQGPGAMFQMMMSGLGGTGNADHIGIAFVSSLFWAGVTFFPAIVGTTAFFLFQRNQQLKRRRR